MPEKKPGQKRDNQVTGNIGLYYVCYQLSKHGWNVMPTARNARGIDIVAYPSDVNAGRYVGIQVKTLSKPQDVGMSEEGLRHNGTIWFVVVLNEGKGEEPTVYCFGDDILEAGTKAENKPVVIETSKAGVVSYWLRRKEYSKYAVDWDLFPRWRETTGSAPIDTVALIQ